MDRPPWITRTKWNEWRHVRDDSANFITLVGWAAVLRLPHMLRERRGPGAIEEPSSARRALGATRESRAPAVVSQYIHRTSAARRSATHRQPCPARCSVGGCPASAERRARGSGHVAGQRIRSSAPIESHTLVAFPGSRRIAGLAAEQPDRAAGPGGEASTRSPEFRRRRLCVAFVLPGALPVSGWRGFPVARSFLEPREPRGESGPHSVESGTRQIAPG